MIEIKDTLTLDDDIKYIVTSKTEHSDGKTYYYLVDIKNTGNIKFGYINDDEFIETNDSELIKSLIPSLVKNAIKELPEDILNKLKINE